VEPKITIFTIRMDRAIEMKRRSIPFFIDYSKLFDAVKHEILLEGL